MKINLQEALLENEEAILTQEEIDSLGCDEDYDYYQFEIDGDYEFNNGYEFDNLPDYEFDN